MPSKITPNGLTKINIKSKVNFHTVNISGESTIQASIEDVWAILINPQKISNCMPGLSSWEIIESEKRFQLFIIWGEDDAPRLKVPITLEWKEITEPTFMLLSGDILVGTAVTETTGELNLTATTPTTTTIQFTAVVDPPNQMIDQMARTLAPTIANTFFKRLQQLVQSK